MKFENGDIVKGITNNYPITNKHMTKAKIVDNAAKIYVEVEVLEHEDGYPIGHKYIIPEDAIEQIEKPKSHLVDRDGDHCGNIGDRTTLVDENDNILFIGDVVLGLKKDYSSVFIDYVAKRENAPAFVMGIRKYFNEMYDTGDWKIFKIKDHKEVRNAEDYGLLMAVIDD